MNQSLVHLLTWNIIFYNRILLSFMKKSMIPKHMVI